MARRRAATPDESFATRGTVASLRLRDRTVTDWAFSAEGWLLVYDPSVVNDAVFEQLHGLQTIAAAALGWMCGRGGNGLPFVAQPEHWPHVSRSETATRVARLVELGWNRSIALLPLVVAANGADVWVRSSPLTTAEEKARREHFREKHLRPKLEPSIGWIETRTPRLGLTWDFLLGFTPSQKRTTLNPGHTIEFDWPAGDYRLTGWTLPEADTSEGVVDQYVLQVDPWTPGK